MWRKLTGEDYFSFMPVMAVGTVPCHPLQKELAGTGIRLREVGDCKGIGDALDAMLDAVELAEELRHETR